MLPASGMEAKYQSLPIVPGGPPGRAPDGKDRHFIGRATWRSPGGTPPRTPEIRDTDGIAAIARHNDGSMGKFSYSG